MKILLFFALVLFITKSCGQISNNRDEEYNKLSLQDSIKVIAYMDSISKAPLYSNRRQRYLDSALSIIPRAAELWQQKAMPLFKQKKYELGMDYLDNAVKYDRTNHYLEYRAFIKCIFQKSYKEAIVDFDLATKQNGNSVVMDHSYGFYKGLCYLQLNKLDSAQYFFIKDINEDKNRLGESWIHPLLYFYIGIVQYEKELYSQSIESFNNCLEKYSQFSDAQFYKALCLEQQGNTKQALELLIMAQENLRLGYTINEDNSVYEMYPYQINKYSIEAYIDYLKQKK